VLPVSVVLLGGADGVAVTEGTTDVGEGPVEVAVAVGVWVTERVADGVDGLDTVVEVEVLEAGAALVVDELAKHVSPKMNRMHQRRLNHDDLAASTMSSSEPLLRCTRASEMWSWETLPLAAARLARSTMAFRLAKRMADTPELVSALLDEKRVIDIYRSLKTSLEDFNDPKCQAQGVSVRESSSPSVVNGIEAIDDAKGLFPSCISRLVKRVPWLGQIDPQLRRRFKT